MTVPTTTVKHADDGRVSRSVRLGLTSPLATTDSRTEAEKLADKLTEALKAQGWTLHAAAGETPQLLIEEYLALRDRIKVNGQQMPIIITDEKRLVDGRHRLMACYDLDLDPVTVTVSEANAREAAFDSELRRHQTKSQMAAFTVLFYEEKVQELTKAGMSSRASKSEYGNHTEISPVTFVQQTAGIGVHMAKMAVALLNAGRIDLLADVRDGKISSMEKAYAEHLQAGVEDTPARYEQLVTALTKAKNALAQAERQAEEIEGLVAFVHNSDELKELAADIRKALLGIDDIDEILERVQPRA